MIQPEKLFENFFDERVIISIRLAGFASDCLNRITQANGANEYNALIALLTPACQALNDELGDVATALSMQRSKTITVDDLISKFKTRMRELEGAIAYKLGGHDKPAFAEFYPKGKTEYHKVTKTNIAVILERIYDISAEHTAALGPEITTELQGWKAQYEQARNNHQQAKGNVDTNRSQRTTARKQVEEALVKVIHNIGERYPGNVQQCMSFFDFSLLDGKSRKKENAPQTPPATS